MEGIENKIQRSINSGIQERTFIDKVLARDDVNKIRELVRKAELTREDLLEILYLISGTEAKLLNYSDWDRYVILKFFVWIREFIKICEIAFDYEDELFGKENTCSTCKKLIDTNKILKMCRCSEDKQIPMLVLSARTKRIFKNNKMLLQHNAKFLVDLYLNICRTSMSVSGTGFSELLKNKYEVVYPNSPTMQGVQQTKPSGVFGWGGK